MINIHQTKRQYFSRADTSHDVWQFGIVIFVCLTGCLPWQKAAADDPRYVRYLSWHSSTIPLKRQPKLFKLVSSKAQRLFKKYLEPRSDKRPAGLADVYRFLEDRWMSKGGTDKYNGIGAEDDGLCPSMYSFHSSPEEKNKLLFTLTQYGIETTVDRTAKKDRIRQWIQSSVIEEENDEDVANEVTDDDIGIRDNQTGPIGERVRERGPISENRFKKKERRVSTLPKKQEVYTPPVDPRIPLEQQRRKATSSATNGDYPIPILKQERLEFTNGFAEDKTALMSSSKEKYVHFSETTEKTEETDKYKRIMKHGINVQIPQSSTMYNNGDLVPQRPSRDKSHKHKNGQLINSNGVKGSQDSPVMSGKRHVR